MLLEGLNCLEFPCFLYLHFEMYNLNYYNGCLSLSDVLIQLKYLKYSNVDDKV